MKRVVAAIIENDGKVLVARRKAGQSHAHMWEFPGGKIEPGETPEQSLSREIWEELGMEISVGEFCASNVFPYKDFTIELLAYWARPLHTQTPTLSVHDEVQYALPEELAHFNLTLADIPIMETVVQKLLQQKGQE
jgi:8-oxo-dGTP diphosphatase